VHQVLVFPVQDLVASFPKQGERMMVGGLCSIACSLRR
jgi:hypothetical protein